jgi:hypothetical protein
MRNHHLEIALQNLYDLAQDPRLSASARRQIYNALRRLEAGVGDMEQEVLDLKMQLLRNPSFPDDLMGYWDDDVADDDEDDTV